MKLKVKRVHPDAKLPTRAYPSDAGMDVYSTEDYILKPGEKHDFDLGIQCQLERTITWLGEEYYYFGLFVFDKSSVGGKQVTHLAGVIDVSYTGNIVVMLHNLSDKEVSFSKGQKLCQLVVLPIPSVGVVEVDKLKDTERSDKGFGSTGTH